MRWMRAIKLRSRKSGARRYRYRVPLLRVEARRPDGLSVCHHAASRNIGRDGMSLLLGSLIYPNTPCRINLITAHNYWHTVGGRLVACQYVPGTASIYEAEAAFDRPIDAALFSPEAMRLRVLLANDSATTRMLLTRMLESLNSEVVSCENGQEAVRRALAEQYDLVFLDLQMPVLGGLEATRELRSRRYVQPIVAITGLNDAELRQLCLRVGFDAFLQKPVSPEALRQLINCLRPEAVVSSLDAEQLGVSEALNQFVRELHRCAWRIQRALAEENYQAVAEETRLLRSEAAGYGFEPIGAIASAAYEALNESRPPEEIYTKLRDLVRLCRAARPSPFA